MVGFLLKSLLHFLIGQRHGLHAEALNELLLRLVPHVTLFGGLASRDCAGAGDDIFCGLANRGVLVSLVRLLVECVVALF